MRYPTGENGVPLKSYEIGLAPSRLDLNRGHNWNNHHRCYPSGLYLGQFVLMETFRDLDTHQDPLPIDVHSILHDTFDGPKPPTIQQAMTVVEEAYEKGIPMKTKSVHSPRYQRITESRWSDIVKEYQKTLRYLD